MRLGVGPSLESVATRGVWAYKVNAVFEQVTGELTEGESVATVKADCAAASISFTVWTDFIKPLWSIRWAATGLMPVRPQIVVAKDFEIPPRSFLKLHP